MADTRGHHDGQRGKGLAGHLRNVSVALLGRARRDPSIAATEAWLDRLPQDRRRAALWAPAGLLLVLALIAAQFGWPGLLVYFVGVIWLAA